jgi:hypothetical protein
MKKINLMLLAATLCSTLALHSCKKEEKTHSPSAQQNSNTTSSNRIGSYDYTTATTTQVIADAIGKDAKKKKKMDEHEKVKIFTGYFVREEGLATICDPGPICVIIIYSGGSSIGASGGTTVSQQAADQPLGVITAYPDGPIFRYASDATWNETPQNGSTSVIAHYVGEPL